jgi:hypothetical protein
MLPAFATLADLAARIPGGIATADETRAQAALDDASTKIRSVANRAWVDAAGDVVEDLPDIVFTVCLKAAQRCFDNPDGLKSEGIGTYAETRANPSADVYLTAEERRDIRRAAVAAGGGGGLWTQPTTRGPLETPGRNGRCDDTVYVDTTGGAPIPFSGPDGY